MERTRRAWAPDAQDHQVFHWVRFEGKRQTWVAYQLGINQATVSRIVERYERWQAHAKEREGGRLDAAERLRAQRWLTYERNEVILASALRIANEMEGFTDVSKSVISRPLSQPSAEREMRTETAVIDRHGIAARFLRLAFRINMEQLKLVEQDAPPLPADRSAAEQEEEERLDAEIAAEVAEAQRRSDEQAAKWAREAEAAASPLAGTQPGPAEATSRMENEVAVLREQVCSRLEDEGMHEVHRMHNADNAETDANAQPACSCAADAAAEKNDGRVCIGEPIPHCDLRETASRQWYNPK